AARVTALRYSATLQAVAGISPATRRSSVLLPHPDGPTIATNSPAPIARSIGSSARVSLRPRRTVFATPASAIAGSGAAPDAPATLGARPGASSATIT